MGAPAHWLIGLIVIGGGIAIWGVLTMLAGRKHRRPVYRRFHCPYKDLDVEARFYGSTLHDRLIDIESCSAFDPPERIGCAAMCVRDFNREASERHAAQHAPS